MTLDGLQKELYDLQPIESIDYWEGYTIRFADDILIASRSEEKAKEYLKLVEQFVEERGLKLSPSKTHIEHISHGFEFLSRFYVKYNLQIHCVPSKNAIKRMENELYDLILNNDKRWSQKILIQSINAKLNGWATYHRITEAKDVFNHIDVLVNALLLNLTKKMHPKKDLKTTIKKYWYKDQFGRDVFTLATNKNLKILKLADVVIVEHYRMDIKQNVYLVQEHFDDRFNSQITSKVSGKYKAVWQRQNGKCFYCGKKVTTHQQRKIIFKKLSKDTSINNMAYVHLSCSQDENIFINSDLPIYRYINVEDIINEIQEVHLSKKASKNKKYDNLYEYFANCKIYTFQLSFEEIEKIIGSKLCDSLYKYDSYWRQNKKGLIAVCWLDNGYEIKKLYLKEKKLLSLEIKSNFYRLTFQIKFFLQIYLNLPNMN